MFDLRKWSLLVGFGMVISVALWFAGCAGDSGETEETAECTTDADCADKGANYRCSQFGVCVQQILPDGDETDDDEQPVADGDEIEDVEEDEDPVFDSPCLDAPTSVAIDAILNEAVRKNLTLSNSCEGTLEITGIRLSEQTEGFALENLPSFPAALSAGHGINVTVSYTAENTGEARDYIQIESNDPDHPVRTVEVTAVTETAGDPGLDVSPQFDFGTVGVGQELTLALFIRNTPAQQSATTPLVIESFALDPAETPHFSIGDSNEERLIIPPGSGGEINIVCHPAAIELQTAKLTFEHNDPNLPSPFQVSLLCTGEGAVMTLSSEPSNLLEFGHVAVDSTATESFTITNAGDVPLVIDDIFISQATSDEFIIFEAPGDYPVSLEADQPLQISVNFFPTNEGEETGQLTISSNDFDEPSKIIGLTGTGIVSNLSLNPETHDFGPTILNDAKTLVVTFANAGAFPANITGVERHHDESAFQFAGGTFPLVVPPNGGETEASLVYLPMAYGEHNEIFYFNVEGSQEKPSLNVSGESGEAIMTLHDQSGRPFSGIFNFGDVPAGETETRQLNITNTGSFPLIIDDLAFHDGSSEYYFVDPASVEPIAAGGGHATLTFTFAPDQNAGTEWATIDLVSNAASMSVVTIQLNGTGISATGYVDPLTTSETPHDFGRVVTGTALEQRVTITNTGQNDLTVERIAFLNGEGFEVDLGNYPTPNIISPASPTMEIFVRFNAETEGIYTDTLEITTDDFQNPVFLVHFRGEAFDCPEDFWSLGDPYECWYECEYQGENELCNGLDDECDGETDEGYDVGDYCAGFGICGEGVIECNPENPYEIVCSTGPGGSEDRSMAEVCNGRDDDCDGPTDEGSGIELCEAWENAEVACVSAQCYYSCFEGYHKCGDACVADNDINHCGMNCEPCPEPENGTVECADFQGQIYYCNITCDDSYVRVGDECVISSTPSDCGPTHINCLANDTVANGDWQCIQNGGDFECQVICDPGFQYSYDPGPPEDYRCTSNNTPDCCGPSCVNCNIGKPENTDASCVQQACSYQCSEGYHDCYGVCVSDNDPATCGTRCTPCSEPENSAATCVDGVCGFECIEGMHNCFGACVSDDSVSSCGTRCTPCPTQDHSNTECIEGECVTECFSNYHMCDGVCQSDFDINTCGDRCEPCPEPPGGGEPGCSGNPPMCTFACEAGKHACGDACVDSYDLAHCGYRCAPCPERDNASVSCNGVDCVYTCDEGYHECGEACVSDNDPATCGDRCEPCPEQEGMISTCVNGQCTFECEEGYYDLDGDPETGCEYECTKLSETDEPDLEGIDDNCDGADGEADRAIYVSRPISDGGNGWVGAAGTFDAPEADLSRAIMRAYSQSPKGYVIVAKGAFAITNDQLMDGVSIYGGYDDDEAGYSGTGSQWRRPASGAETSLFTQSNPGLIIEDFNEETTYQKLSIANEAPTGSDGDIMSYGLVMKNVSNAFRLDACKITVAAAPNGTAGENGVHGVQSGSNGTNGSRAVKNSDNRSNSNGNGGFGGCGNNGGDGGQGGWPTDGEASRDGQGGQGNGGGLGGTRSNPPGGDGADGNPGQNGGNGNRALRGGYTDTFGYWVAYHGANGGNGTNGAGGAGGGGGVGDFDVSTTSDTGAGGGGGGGGGCAATGGEGGSSGGSVFGIYLINSSPVIHDCEIITGNAGNGGDGGVGGDGTSGGAGGAGGASVDNDDAWGEIGRGGNGGDGGDGGDGGNGGGGAGGSNYGIFCVPMSGSSPSVSQSGFDLGTAGLGGDTPESASDGQDGERLEIKW